MYTLVFTAPRTLTAKFHVTKHMADAPRPKNKRLNKEQLTDTLNKKGKDENLLDELEDEIKTGIGDVLFPQKALVPISIKESAEER